MVNYIFWDYPGSFSTGHRADDVVVFVLYMLFSVYIRGIRIEMIYLHDKFARHTTLMNYVHIHIVDMIKFFIP